MNHLLSYAVPLFILMDFIGTLPVFLTLTRGAETGERIRAAVLCSVIAGTIVAAFALSGQALLSYFDVSIEAVRVGGGLLLLYIAFEMIMSGKLIYSQAEDHGTFGVVVSPLAIPMLAGPGSMTYAMVSYLGLVPAERVWFLGAVVACVAVGSLLLALSSLVQRILGQEFTRGLEKVTAVVVSFIALEMILRGVKAYLFA